MFNKTLVSPIALAFGLALTGAAAAQTFVGTQDVSDADLPEVQAHCEALAADEGFGADAEFDAGADVDADAGVDADIDTGIDADVDAGVDAEVDTGMDADADADLGMEAGVDLDAITLEDCQIAGLVE